MPKCDYGHRRHEWLDGKCTAVIGDKACEAEQCHHDAHDKNAKIKRRCKNAVIDPDLWPEQPIDPRFCHAHQAAATRYDQRRYEMHELALDRERLSGRRR